MLDGQKIKAIFGDSVKALRKKSKMTQEKAAESIGIELPSFNRIENGKTFISAEVLANLCNVFNVEPYVLFSKKVRYNSEEEVQYIEEINRLLPGFNAEKLEEIYNIILALKK